MIDEEKVFLERTAWDTTYHRPTVTRAADGEIFRSRYNSRGYGYQHQHYQADQSWTSTWTLTDTTASGAPVIQQFMGGIEQKINRYAGSDIIDGICAGGVNCLQSDQIQSIDYSHNAWGSVTGEAHQHNGLDYAYSYDTLHRLESQTVTSSDYPQYDRSVSYTYDAVGNLTSKSDYATSLSYGNSARSAGGKAGPHAVRQVTTTDGQSHSLVYDNAGNLITGIDGLSVGYDNYNQANRIERNGIVTEYFYGTGIDAYKKIETEGSNVTTTLYIGNYEEITTDSATKERTTHGGYLVITRENETIEQSILLQDRLGSVTTIVDANLQPGDSDFIRQFRSYDPFGQSRDFQGQDSLDSFNTTDQGFTGHRHLNDQKLIHMRGRVYDYQLGRFLSPDPIILDPQDSQSLNAYSYVMNNPLAGTDPTGYMYETGQEPNGRSQSEATPTTESGQKALKDKKKRRGPPSHNTAASRIDRSKGQKADVSGSGGSISVSSITVGQEAITSAGEGSRSGGASEESQADGQSGDSMPITGSSNVACDSCHPTSNFEFDGSGVDAGASLIADLFPGVGSAKSLGQVFTGTDLITGEPVNRWLEGGGILLGMIPFGKTLTKGDEMVDLYRAVSADELAQIRRTGSFEAGPNSLGGKFFAENLNDAARWGEVMDGAGNYHLLRVQLPANDAGSLMRWNSLDGIGPARYGELDQLKNAIISVIE
ncbi:RHS repeat-associated core domain-containing protein [Microbulbifer sp. VAAF005]|uniref:RHS repeat-associated core domain-containing protein n=1 Tax=Microbulbifer sp. VAAF005 TaxID=3034230 RepID=UPI0024ACB58C|nr:RHS repeat-associated core domain-containing protein [Microbulbifer sp. VAAF005]WHI47326.1 RHS repeat-associated core domain-containing protein [Microbulbifer sp. VAAF005]